jgi:alkylhydroperoxidase family enzyme
VVGAVLADWRGAPIDERFRATLGFLEKLTLRPDELAPADAAAVLATGVSRAALVDAIHVAALFNMIVRIADSLGFEVPPPDALRARAEWRLQNSYRLLDSPVGSGTKVER